MICGKFRNTEYVDAIQFTGDFIEFFNAFKKLSSNSCFSLTFNNFSETVIIDAQIRDSKTVVMYKNDVAYYKNETWYAMPEKAFLSTYSAD